MLRRVVGGVDRCLSDYRLGPRKGIGDSDRGSKYGRHVYIHMITLLF